MWTIPEVAAALRLSKSKTYELVQRGEIRSVRIGRSRRVPQREIERFIEARMAEVDQATA